MHYNDRKLAKAARLAMLRAMFVVLVWSAACAPAAQNPTARPSATIIELAELESRSFPSVYDAIRNLRPSWLLGTLGGVYVDDVRVAGVDWLHETSVAQVQRIELLSAEEATAKWGTRAMSARFILVRRRR